MDYNQRIESAKSIAEMFALVKAFVHDYCGAEQAGLLLGLSDLGLYKQGFVGAFYSPDANTIIVNKKPLSNLRKSKPDLYNQYLFHVLLHEYVHSLGVYDEAQTREIVRTMCFDCFGKNHILTDFAADITKYLHHFSYAGAGFVPPKGITIDYILGIDKKNTNYIA